jgi:two-component system chemotaxis response regulator CheB
MKVIRTLIVDDSAFARKVLRQMLSRSPYIEVIGAARDGREALELAEELKPDVVTCDLVMPELDGVGFVREQMTRAPMPILILTASPQDATNALEAMEAGAVDFIQKPNASASDEILSIRDDLIEKVKIASRTSPRMHLNGKTSSKIVAVPNTQTLKVDIVLIGISTGGPQALRKLLPSFPANFPVPIAMVLHMPPGYTQAYAEKLGELCAIKVKEAREGDELKPGLALLAQAGRHLILRRNSQGMVIAHLALQPNNSPHRPSVDVLFQSAAEAYGGRVLGVVMTGMGSDGKEGAAWIKAQGGTVLTEAEESCVIYGMPRTVVEAGLSDQAVPLNGMAKTILKYL